MLWKGEITLDGNTIENASLLNNWNLDRGISDLSSGGLTWSAVTTGNYGAIDLRLDNAATGRIKVRTSFCDADLDLGDWDGSEIRIDAGGLCSGMRLYALPETMSETRLTIDRRITTPKSAERRLYVRVQQEDGHRAWASPTYVMSI